MCATSYKKEKLCVCSLSEVLGNGFWHARIIHAHIMIIYKCILKIRRYYTLHAVIYLARLGRSLKRWFAYWTATKKWKLYRVLKRNYLYLKHTLGKRDTTIFHKLMCLYVLKNVLNLNCTRTHTYTRAICALYSVRVWFLSRVGT